jgi:hypothetical protein
LLAAARRIKSGRLLVWGEQKPERDISTNGAKVKIKQTPSVNGRPHLLQHARQGDVGTVAGPPQRSPKMANLYVIVRFDQCGQNHRLLKEEILET